LELYSSLHENKIVLKVTSSESEEEFTVLNVGLLKERNKKTLKEKFKKLLDRPS
jgi:hypothetical protein